MVNQLNDSLVIFGDTKLWISSGTILLETLLPSINGRGKMFKLFNFCLPHNSSHGVVKPTINLLPKQVTTPH